jgi:hypothetical protein
MIYPTPSPRFPQGVGISLKGMVMPKGQAPPYPQIGPYTKKPPVYTEVSQEPVAKNHDPEQARALAEKSMMLEEGRRNAFARRGGKRII